MLAGKQVNSTPPKRVFAPLHLTIAPTLYTYNNPPLAMPPRHSKTTPKAVSVKASPPPAPTRRTLRKKYVYTTLSLVKTLLKVF